MAQDEPLDMACEAAAAGASVAADLFRSELAVETKANATDWVTRADREAETAITEVIRNRDPDAVVVAEEDPGPNTVPAEGRSWIVDPIDGTNNYVRGIRNWVTSVAVAIDGEPAAAVNACPALGDTYFAGRGDTHQNGNVVSVNERADPETFAVAPTIWWDQDHRDEYAAATREIVERFGDLARFRSAQLVLSLIAAGALEGALTNVTVNPWDSIAGVHLVERAGGRVTDLSGNPWEVGAKGLVASNGRCHEEVLAAARAIENPI